MKLKNFFLSILAGATLFAGCAQEQVISSIPEFKTEKSYIGIPIGGGVATSAIEAGASWNIDAETIPSWLTVSPLSGGKGGESLVFAADVNESGAERKAVVMVQVAGTRQRLTVVQEGPVVDTVTPIGDVLAASDGQVFRVKGKVTSISSTAFGNLYLEDETGTIYIYGIKNAQGQYPKDSDAGWDEYGIEVGDVVTVQGPRNTHNGTVELKDAAVLEVEKSLINVEPTEIVLDSYEAGTFTVTVVSKATGMLVIPSAEWIKVLDIAPGDKDEAIYSFSVEENPSTTKRSATIDFKAADYLLTIPVTQAGAPIPEDAKGSLKNPYTPAEAAEAVQGLTWTSNTEYESIDGVYIQGKICRIASGGTYTEGGTYGNASFYLSADGTGEGDFYVFRALYLGNVKFAAGKTDIQIGDEVIIYGNIMYYKAGQDGAVPETVSGKAYLYSLNGKTE